MRGNPGLILVILALLVGASFLLTVSGWAQAAKPGAQELQMLEFILTGNFGLALGLGAALFGVYQFSQGNTVAGITIVIAGVLIVLAPGVFNGTRMVVCGVTSLLVSSAEASGC